VFVALVSLALFGFLVGGGGGGGGDLFLWICRKDIAILSLLYQIT
jgi:hypothetical protein